MGTGTASENVLRSCLVRETLWWTAHRRSTFKAKAAKCREKSLKLKTHCVKCMALLLSKSLWWFSSLQSDLTVLFLYNKGFTFPIFFTHSKRCPFSETFHTRHFILRDSYSPLTSCMLGNYLLFISHYKARILQSDGLNLRKNWGLLRCTVSIPVQWHK